MLNFAVIEEAVSTCQYCKFQEPMTYVIKDIKFSPYVTLKDIRHYTCARCVFAFDLTGDSEELNMLISLHPQKHLNIVLNHDMTFSIVEVSQKVE